jgi:hypothetical protein
MLLCHVGFFLTVCDPSNLHSPFSDTLKLLLELDLRLRGVWYNDSHHLHNCWRLEIVKRIKTTCKQSKEENVLYLRQNRTYSSWSINFSNCRICLEWHRLGFTFESFWVLFRRSFGHNFHRNHCNDSTDASRLGTNFVEIGMVQKEILNWIQLFWLVV